MHLKFTLLQTQKLTVTALVFLAAVLPRVPAVIIDVFLIFAGELLNSWNVTAG